MTKMGITATTAPNAIQMAVNTTISLHCLLKPAPLREAQNFAPLCHIMLHQPGDRSDVVVAVKAGTFGQGERTQALADKKLEGTRFRASEDLQAGLDSLNREAMREEEKRAISVKGRYRFGFG